MPKRLWAILLLFIFIIPIQPIAAQAPKLPHAFFGRVTINGNPAPVGSVVEAQSAGILSGIPGNPLSVKSEGLYGGPGGFDPKLLVQGDLPDNAAVLFFVNGKRAQCALPGADWQDDFAFQSSAITELNLRVDDATGVMPTTLPVSTNTPQPTQVPTKIATQVPVATNVPTQVAVATNPPTQVPTAIATQLPAATDVPTQMPTRLVAEPATQVPTLVQLAAAATKAPSLSTATVRPATEAAPSSAAVEASASDATVIALFATPVAKQSTADQTDPMAFVMIIAVTCALAFVFYTFNHKKSR